MKLKRFRGRLVFKAHRLLYHSTLGLRVIKKKSRHLEEAVEVFERDAFQLLTPLPPSREPAALRRAL